MVQRDRVFRQEGGATHAPLRLNDCQFALGFESANLRKNRRPPARAGRRSALRLLPISSLRICDVSGLVCGLRNFLRASPFLSIKG
jgi:hypothetical protein